MRRVVLTGLGHIGPCGDGRDALWQAAVNGQSGITKRTGDDAPMLAIPSAGIIREFNPRQYVNNRKALKVMCRDIQMAVAASHIAATDAGLEEGSFDPDRAGVCIGAGIFEHDPREMADSFRAALNAEGGFDCVQFGKEGMGELFPLWLLKYLPNMPACHITIAHKLQGPSNTLTADSCGSAEAIEESVRMIERGSAEVMFCGGSECRIYGDGLVRYHSAGWLSGEDSTSYDVFSDRGNSMIAGEGGTVLILEEYEHAKKRGAQIYCEVTGIGPSAAGGDQGYLKRSIKSALGDTPAGEVDTVHLSARGLESEDKEEADAIKEIFTDHKPKLTASKYLTGFLGYAAAPTEFALAALSLKNKKAIPSGLKDGHLLSDSFQASSSEDSCGKVLVNHFESGLSAHSFLLDGGAAS